MDARYLKALLLCLVVASPLALADANNINLTQRNSADTGNVFRLLPTPAASADGIIYYNGATSLPGYVTVGTGLSISSGVISSTNNGTVTSVTAGTGLSGGTITTSGTISMPNIGTAGSYANVTTDAQGRVTAGTNRSQATAARALNSAFQINATRDAWVTYSVQITVTASIAGGQNGDVVLEIASDSGFTANVQTLAISGLGQTYTLAIALQGIQPQTGVVTGYVPAGYYTRLRTVNNTGTPSFSYRAGQEVLQ
jgi:hypothetical protein